MSTEIDVADGLTVNIPSGNFKIVIGSNDTVNVGNGTDTITAGDYDNITVGSLGNSTITLGTHDTFTAGNGTQIVTGGAYETIKMGNGNDSVTVGKGSSIVAGNGNDNLTAGPNSTITAGNGTDNVHAGATSTIVLGSGPDTVSAGTTDTITVNMASSKDTIKYDGLTPKFTVPGSDVHVTEEHSVSLPITLLPPNFGTETINGFKAANGIVYFDRQDFATYAALLPNMAQVGANVVITQPGGSGTVTLTNTKLSSLTSANFGFFTGATDTISISGVPTDATLNHGTQTSPGTWALLPSDLSGLTLNAGEPIGYPSPDVISVTITNPSGQQASSTQMFNLIVDAIAPTVSESVLAYQTGDPVTETRLQITSAVDDGDGGADYINRLVFSNVAIGTTLSSASGTVVNNGGGVWTLTTSGHPANFNPEIDVFAPGGQTTNFVMGITAYADEPNSPELNAATSQQIYVNYSTTTQNPDFLSSGQSIWTSGTSFTADFHQFIGGTIGPYSTSTGFHLSIPYIFSFGQSVGATVYLKSGFQADLHIDSGTFAGDLPFQVNLANTYNEINHALQVDPTDSQAGGGGFTTTSPNGSFGLDFILDIVARIYTAGDIGNASTGFSTHIFQTLVHFNSSTLATSFDLPDGFGTVAIAWPTVNTVGSNPNPGPITSQGVSNPIFQLNIDPIAVVLDLLFGSDPLKGTLFGGAVSYTILAATLAPGVDLQQNFNLTAALTDGTITPHGGVGQSFNFGSPIIIPNSDGMYSLTLDPDANLENTTSLAGQVVLGLRVLQGSISFGGLSTSFGPLANPKTTLGPAPFATLYHNTFAVDFNQLTLPTVLAA
ncbi:MAG: beta strand repeat-containing protein [Sphingomicrobium sp.]